MILKRLLGFLTIVFIGIALGILFIDLIRKNMGLPDNLTHFIMLSYIIIFIIIAIILGKDIPKESNDEDIILPTEKKKNSKRNYAWLIPMNNKTQAGFPITKRLHIIGRDVHSDILINEDSVSKKHAQILALEGGYVIKDLESTNGTFINNQRIVESFLGEGDIVTFGEAKFTFLCPSTGSQMADGELKFNPDIELDLNLDIDISDYDTGTRSGLRSGIKSGARFSSGSRLRDFSKDKKDTRLDEKLDDETYVPDSSGKQKGKDSTKGQNTTQSG